MNNEFDKVSVIVPVYNAKLYLRSCVDSLIAQTYPNIEIILVNDGSIDGSSEICDNYAGKDSRIKVVHKANGGVSSARNKGIDIAEGDYIMFVDADDYVSPTLCEKLTRGIDEKTDVVISGFIEDFGKGQQVIKVLDSICRSVDDLKQNFDMYYRLPLLNSPFAKLYKRSLLKDIRFNSNVSMGEDFLFNLECYKRSNNIKFIPNADYYYNCTNIGSATKKYKEEYFNYYIKCYEEGKRFKYGEIKFTNDALDETFCSNCLYFVQTIVYNVKDKKEMRSGMEKVLDNSYFQIVCAGEYNYPFHLKIMQAFSKGKKYGLLKIYLGVKKILSTFRR